MSRMSTGEERSGVLRLLRDTPRQNLAFFQRTWRAHEPASWAGSAELYRLFGEKVLQLGEPFLAYDVASEGLQASPGDIALRRLAALALARSGAAEQANSILSALYGEGHRDEETVGLLARTHKDLAAEAGNATQRKRHLRQAHDLYLEAYRRTGGYWTGINAATLGCLLHERRRAADIAAQVEKHCRRLLDGNKADPAERYWICSTLGEAALVQQNWDDAEQWYAQAVEAGRGDWGSMQSTRHNARLLIESFGEDAARFEQIFPFPTVVVFSGHLLDQPQRRKARFPAVLAPAIKDEIRNRVRKLNAEFGYASAACGADILFHEVMLEGGGESHVVLPYSRGLFLRKSVNVSNERKWVRRYQDVLARAVEVEELSSDDSQDEAAALDFANRMLHGLARLRAEQLETRLIGLAVWDGKPGDGPGGTADNVARWRRLGLHVDIIDPRTLAQRPRPVDIRGGRYFGSRKKSASNARGEFAAEIRALLFADFEGFSKLNDAEVPRFVRHCLGLVGRLAAESRHRPLMKNTWGDGLYLVFRCMRDAGNFAIELRDRIRRMPWSQKGLPLMKVRIGLHAGPVFWCTDPVTRRPTYTGAHVSRAARIEPITPTGQVYASQSFAALASGEGVREFRCNYVGQTSLAKKYGTYPTYVVLRRALAHYK